MDYNIRLEYQLAPTEENGQALVEALESFSPAAGPNDNGNLDVWITVPANNARQAIDTGLALSRTAAAADLVAFEAITTEEFDRREWVTPVPELVTAEQAGDMLGISRQAVGQKFTAGQLPGRRIGERVLVFARRDIEQVAARKKAQEVVWGE
jgi:predicted DNA-binding transcriptional regulator AlpA